MSIKDILTMVKLDNTSANDNEKKECSNEDTCKGTEKIQNDALNEKTPEECIDQNENKRSFKSVDLIPNMVNGFSQNLNFAFPCVNKSQPTDEADGNINDKSKSQDASLDSISNEKQNSKDTSYLQENCCPELCKEVSAEARTLAKDARHLSNEMSEIIKEADILNKKASEVAHLCDGGIQGDTGLVTLDLTKDFRLVKILHVYRLVKVLPLDLESDFSDVSDYKKRLNNKYVCTNLGKLLLSVGQIFLKGVLLGLGFGASCGYMIGHMVMKAKEEPSDN